MTARQSSYQIRLLLTIVRVYKLHLLTYVLSIKIVALVPMMAVRLWYLEAGTAPRQDAVTAVV